MSCEHEEELLLVFMDLQANLTLCCVCLLSSLAGVWYTPMGWESSQQNSVQKSKDVYRLRL